MNLAYLIMSGSLHVLCLEIPMSERYIKTIVYVSVGLSWGITIVLIISFVLEILTGKDLI